MSARSRIILIYIILLAANAAAWAWALLTLRGYPVLLGTALLAYTFGLRHAVDADHIAAIDNVTRKLMQQGKKPVAVGFFFALGHLSIVALGAGAVALTTTELDTRFAALKDIGGVIGTSISALFLLLIAAMNLFILRGVYRSFQRVRRGERYVEADFDMLSAQGGVMARLFRPLFGLMTASWHMYPLGFLFGLGFETATEVALLGMSAEQAARGADLATILMFPALFTVGMTLIDTTDGVLMLGAYGWAFVKPIRKLYYNMTITLVSAVVALLIGGIETLGLLADQLALKGRFWSMIGTLTDSFGLLGYLIIGLFIVSWLVSALIYRLKRFDEIEAVGK